MATGLIIAVGLDSFVTDFVLREVRPSCIAFLATEATLPIVQEMVRSHQPVVHKVCFIKDIFSTAETVQEFLNAFQWLKSQPDITEAVVDATNCITVVEMATYVSASLIDLYRELLHETVPLRLVYVHCQFAPSDTGVYAEVRGSERLIEIEQPIDTLGFVLFFEALRSFNHRRYVQARESFEVLTRHTSGERHHLAQGLSALSAGYEQWDKLLFEEAKTTLQKSWEALRRARGFKGTAALCAGIETNIQALAALTAAAPVQIVIDLWHNASRREAEARYDDALARLYACIERIVQHQLSMAGINTAAPDYSVLPDGIVNSFCRGMRETLPVELELKRAAALLALLDDPIGRAVNVIGSRVFTGLLGLRNASILAHGLKPIGSEHYQNFRDKLFMPLWKAFREAHQVNDGALRAHEHLMIEGLQDMMWQQTAAVQDVVAPLRPCVGH